MIAVEFTYRAPDATLNPLHVARADDGQFLFVYADIARALMTKSPDRTSPICDSAHARRVRFDNLKNERKCVTLDGLSTCTPTSCTDDGTEAASGPAIHFHRWLCAVVLPALESDDWPPSKLALDTLQCGWLESERDALTQAIDAIRADMSAKPAPPIESPASKPIQSAPPGTMRAQVFPDSAGFAITDCDDFLSV